MGDYIYCFVISCENKPEHYAAASNFISKVVSGQEVLADDIKFIKYFRIPTAFETKINDRVIIEQLLKCNLINIKDIKSFNDTIRTFRVAFVYNINYEECGDVSELRNFILTKNFYEDTQICALISGTTNNYFKISHYLMLYSMNDNFYNSIFFTEDENKIQRLQKNSIGTLSDFLPLFPIHNKNRFVDVLFENNADYKSFKEEQRILKRSCDRLISTFIKNVKKNNNENDITADDIFSVCNNASLIELCLFCFSLNGNIQINAKSEIIALAKEYFITIQKYSACLRQLAENVIFHSAIKQGVLSFRAFEPKKHSAHLNDKYGQKNFDNEIDRYLEVVVSDYSGHICNGNIPEHFLRSLSEEHKKCFQSLTLKDFFKTDNKELESAWAKYYSHGDNWGKHYGLKIFNSLINDASGIFIVDTHNTHTPNENEYFHSKDDSVIKTEISMPGTSYSILFPTYKLMKKARNNSDVSITTDIHIKWEDYLGYACENVSLFELRKTYKTADKKSEDITHIIDLLKKTAYSIRKDTIIQIDVQGKDAYYAEIACKAIVILLTFKKESVIPSIAFYNCNDIFINIFIETIKVFWTQASNIMLPNMQIALIPAEQINYTVIIPSSESKTSQINRYIARSRATVCNYFDNYETFLNEESPIVEIIPFEILVRPKDGKRMTLFEIYTHNILKSNVQKNQLGCKIEDTHMRLGSSIHIDDFYEAELLFGNKLFVSCFTFLLVRDILNMHIENDIVLYGYASYSEMLLYNIKKLLKKTDFGLKRNIDNILLDREADNRGTGHVDLLRKSSDEIFQNNNTIIFIVPINSTMKTLGKMYDRIEKFLTNGNKFTAFTLITIAPAEENYYWKFEDGRKIVPKNNLDEVFEKITYYITAETTYHEAVLCKLCYPDNPIHEKPLIEVNASSTIPNQSFQLVERTEKNTPEIKEEVREQIDFINSIKETLLYGHTYRGENHFLYYIKTELLFQKCKDKIAVWLEKEVLSLNASDTKTNIYNIIFCPMHFSNVDFVEMVNDIVFQGAAMAIRVDVDKEYRSNFKAKFSNISSLLKNLNTAGKEYSIRIHYVDDTIVTGRTYHRSKSMVTTLFTALADTPKTENLSNVRVFHSIILLLNRNSNDSLAEYEENFSDNTKTRIYKFFNLRIPSIRTHGDSCVLCNLKRDADLLCAGASTYEMYNYWNNKLKNSFTQKRIKDYKNKSTDKAIRRLLCAHMAGLFLPKLSAYNSRKSAMDAILALINIHLSVNIEQSCESNTEIFYSYIKVLSRPFISFDKFIKEAVFDLLLILIEALLDNGKKDIKEYIALLSGEGGNKYLKQYELSIADNINNALQMAEIKLNDYNKDLLKILMKQLTELKSNYVIRVRSMNKIISYVNEEPETEKHKFLDFYAHMVKRLVSVGSDTSKSVWLDYILLYRTEPQKKEELLNADLMNQLVNMLIVENTRVYFDAVEHLNEIKKLKFDYDSQQISLLSLHKRISDYLKEETLESEKEKFFNMLYGNSLVKSIYDNTPILKEKKYSEVLAYFNERFRETDTSMYINNSDAFDEDLKLLNNAINGHDFIYENFRKVLKNLRRLNCGSADDCNRDSKNVLLDKPEIGKLIMASVHLLRYISLFDNETENLDTMDVPHRYRKLAIIIRELLDANNVSIIVQNDVSLNSWVNLLFNKAQKKNLSLENVIPQQGNDYEYIVLSSSNTMEGEDDEYCPKDLYQNINNYIEKNHSEFYVSDDVFIWKIDSGNHHPIFIYADFCAPNRMRRINVKCLMMMRRKLKKNVFGVNKNDYIHELVQERNELMIQKRNKSHTHTNNSAQGDYYLKALKENNPEKNLGIIMILLADLAVSETYRQSLSSDFYTYNLNFSCISWKDSLFKTINTFVYSDDRSVKVIINDEFPDWHKEIFPDDKIISDSDQLITICTPPNEQKPLYFLLAMAQNALKVTSNSNKNSAEVYITKTQSNNIRVCNLIEANSDEQHIERIKNSISNPPLTRDQGITMWSVSRFVKMLTITAANKYIDKITTSDFKPEILKELFSDEFNIKVKPVENSQKRCLSIEIPLLKDKYDYFL